MKNQARLLSLLIGLTFTFGGGRAALADRPVLGSPQPSGKGDDRMQGAAEFAAKENGVNLVSIKSSTTQVVAGVIYDLCLAVSSDGAEKEATAKVFLPLAKGAPYEMKGWSEGNCSGEQPADDAKKDGDEVDTGSNQSPEDAAAQGGDAGKGEAEGDKDKAEDGDKGGDDKGGEGDKDKGGDDKGGDQED